MAQILRILITYPTLFLLQKIIRRFSLFVGLIIFLCIVIFTGDYIKIFFFEYLLQNERLSEENETTESIVKEVTITKGDNLGTILRKENLPNSDIRELINLATNEKITSQLKIGQKLSFEYNTQIIEKEESDLNEESTVLDRMVFIKDKINSIEFVRQEGKFVALHITSPLKKLITQYNATIDSSLIASLQKAGMSTNSIIRLINAYSHQIDFQRQIRSGDKISVIAEKFVTDKNEFSHHGKILYANLNSRNTDYSIYRYSPSGKIEDLEFFSEDGQSIKSTLLRTPVKIVRISGNYGYRKKHPVLGYGAMHKGVDFAASIGTPIYASGNGTITFMGWKSGYGRFILLQHDKTLSTAYAHSSKFANGLRKGSRVKQGDIIAYVGQSGRVTGPHLHYEVRINGKQVNPMKFKSKPGIQLAGVKLASFIKHKKQLLKLGEKLGDDLELSPEEINGIKLF
jgi:murein DD-endopeptidase MepM/ murein hydrolase activator NlpD